MSISSEKLRKVLHPIQIDTMHFRFKPRRNPGSQSQHRSVNRTAVTEYHKENYENAVEYALKINLPGFHWAQIHLAAAYGQLGRAAEGEATINRVLEIYPDFAEKAWNEYRMFNIPDELIRRSLDGLRKAGLDVPNDPE